MAGMRDITAHRYQTLRMEDVYNTAYTELPAIKDNILDILKNEE
jgi:uncharacterized protein with HEPN domain